MQLAIIEDNVLAGIGLQQLLKDMLPKTEVLTFGDVSELSQDVAELCAHFFVSSHVYFTNISFFQSFLHKTIVLVNGSIRIKGVSTLNVSQDEKTLIRDIFSLHRTGHGSLCKLAEVSLLSTREIEVVVLLCHGLINKEIADRLNISLATVITHRKNIMGKLHARTLADVIIFSLLNGYINIGDL